MKRVLVCGGRNYGRFLAGKEFERPRRAAERRKLCATLGQLAIEFGAFQLIHGGGTGADALAGAWAASADGFPKPIEYKAAWDDVARPGAVLKTTKAGKTYDAAAGPERNRKMIEEGKPDLVIAFPGGDGTEDTISRAERAEIEVRRVK